MNIAISLLLTVVALIHLLPVTGVVSTPALSKLYGLPAITDRNLAILMRHRAVLFGMLGTGLLIAAWMPAYFAAALIAGWASVLSFLGLAHSVGGYNKALRRVVIADWIALACLAAATALYTLM